MSLNMIPGWCMEPRWLCSPVGIRIRDCSSTAQESLLGWASRLDYLADSAGVGTIGGTIGTTTGESSTTTTTTSRIATLSSIETIFIRREGTSITPPIHMAAVLAGTPRPVVSISGPSAGSIMEALQEPTHPKDDPVLVAFMEGAVEASMVVEAGTAAEATDSSREVMKP